MPTEPAKQHRLDAEDAEERRWYAVTCDRNLATDYGNRPACQADGSKSRWQDATRKRKSFSDTSIIIGALGIEAPELDFWVRGIDEIHPAE
jgi:hypothetical protein